MSDTLAIINYPVVSALGEALAGVTVAVLTGDINGASPVDVTTLPGSPLATIYSDPQGLIPLANPTTTDGLGNLLVCVASGYYVLQIYGPGINGQQLIGVSVGIGSGGATSLADLTDVSLTSLIVGQALKWNGSVWTNTANTLALLGDVSLTSLLSTQALTWNGSAWTNTTLIAGPVGVNPQTTDYIAVLGDANNLVVLNDPFACTFTIPPHSNVAFPVGTTLTVTQRGAGQIILTPGAGVTIRTPSSLTTRSQFSTVALVQITTNEWVAGGDLT